MDSTEQILSWAEGHAENLKLEMRWTSTDYGGGYWKANDHDAWARIRARATAALDFLDRFAGADSTWALDAHSVFNSKGDNQSMESGARAIGDVITEWRHYVRLGQLRPRSVESIGVREIASTDLMDQVRLLNEDPLVVPAASIVLAGAALEIALRSLVEAAGLETSGSPSITSYARILRTAGILNRQDIKDVEQIAGLRNAAAHGLHAELSRERAGLLEQQVNLFLRRLEQLATPDKNDNCA